MKTLKCFILTFLFTTLIALPFGFAQDEDILVLLDEDEEQETAQITDDSERPIVRLIYFLPNDRTPQPDINEKIETLIKDVQTLFADQMEAHGFGRKTFLYETDARGKAVVHHVIGQHTDAYYDSLPYTFGMWSEIDNRFDTTKNMYLTAIDISGEILDIGLACGRGSGWNSTGQALVPASGKCLSVRLIAHELGHVFGLDHGFYGRDINNKQIWTYTDDQMLNTFWTADWLNVHRAFNPTQDPVSAQSPTVRMLPLSLAAPPNEIRLRFEITGANAHLHQAQLIKTPDANNLYPLFLAGQRLPATPNSIVEFVTTALTPDDRSVYLKMIDDKGNMIRTQEFSIDITPLLPAAADTFSPTYTRGKGSVSDIAYSPDGQYFAVSGGIGISLYDAANQRFLHLLSHTKAIGSIAFSPDGELLAGGDTRGTTHLWDVVTGEIKDTLPGNTIILDTAFSPDGKLLAIAGSDGSIRLWDVDNDIIHDTLKDRVVNIRSIAFSPDGKTLASGDLNNAVHLWDVRIGKIRHTFTEHQGWVQSVAFSPDGNTLATCALENKIYLWEAATGKIQHTLISTANWVQSVAFSPDSNTLAVGNINNVELWDVATGKIRHTLTEHTFGANKVAFSTDGSTLASASYHDSRIRLWDINTLEPSHTFTEHSGGISRVLFSPDGQTLVSLENGTIRLWDVGTGKVRHTLTGSARSSFAFSPDSQILASEVFRDTSIHLWDVYTGKTLRTLPIKNGESLQGITFSPNGETLLCAIQPTLGDKFTIHLWDVRTGVSQQTIPIIGNVYNGVFSPDGRTLAGGFNDGSIHLWDVATGKIRHTLIGHNGSVSNITFSPDGNTIATASSDTTVRLWDVRTGKNRQNPIRHQVWVSNAVFSPNGNTIATASSDTIQLWDVKTGRHRKTLKPQGAIQGMAFSPDGQTLLAAGNQGTLQFWETSSDLPLPVTLSSFKATRTANGVILNWETESELDNAGFNILRSRTKTGEFKKINAKLIQGAGTTGEHNTYSWTDTTAKPNTVYYYRIEDVSHAGVRQTLTTTRLRGLISAKGKMITHWAAFKYTR